MDNSIVVESVPVSGGFFSRMMDIKVGIMPLPVYLVLACIVIGASLIGKLPADMIGGFATIMVFGFFLGHVGGKIPVLNTIGGSAILSLFVPSALLAYGIFNPSMKSATVAIMKTSNFLYLYISCLVAGSLLGMNRKVLVQGFMRMFVPLLVGTIAATVVGISVGLLFGYSPYKTFFFILIPIMGGGIGEGILPLSMAYAEILGKPQGDLIAMMIPAALIGNVVAIVSAGAIKRYGEKNPQYNGKGLLVRTGEDNELLKEMNTDKPVELPLMGCGLLIACSFWIFGSFLAPYTGIPGPILMILCAALAKVTQIVPARMEQGAYQMYKFMTSNMTYPLLVGLGILYVPWKDLIGAFTIGYFCICTSAVLAMISSGWFIGKFLNMYQVESAVVTACHSGLGGTGDVAILSACDRMGLMPFAQISTRIGGASMVVLAVFAIKLFA